MAYPNWQIPGKTVLITGAARGIGAESARRLAARGMKVSLVGLEGERLATVAAECGPDAVWFEADVTDRSQLQAAVDGTVEQLGGIDVVIANAGILVTGPVRLLDPTSFERVIEINLLGVYRTVHACLPQIVARGGYVLVVSSVAAIAHGAGSAAYSASKAGAEAFANCLRAELRHHDVGVGVAYLGFVDTDIMRAVDADPLIGETRSRVPRPMRRLRTLAQVGEVLAKGVERRSRVVAVPSTLVKRVMLPLRGLLTRVAERGSRADFAEYETAFERDVAERGLEASKPLGAGGTAARR